MPKSGVEISGLEGFAQALKAAAGEGLKNELRHLMDAIGLEFLRIVQVEIKDRKIVRTRLLLSSFQKGASNNIWLAQDGGLTIDVGSNVYYARYVNDGHHAVNRRWIDGKKYWEAALRHAEPIMSKMAQDAVDQWAAKYFS